MRALIPILLVAFTACSPIRTPSFPKAPAAVVGTSLSRADAIADLDSLMHTLETVHPNLYAIRSRDAAADDRQKLVADLPESMTRAEWWLRLSPFVAAFGDGHTHIFYPQDELVRDPNARLFPAAVGLDPDRHLVVTLSFDRPGGLRRGDRIVEVNGHNVDDLVRQWMGEVSGESNLYRAVGVADSFRELLLLHSINAPYEVKVAATDSAERGVDLAGITRQGIRESFHPDWATGKGPKNFSYRTLEPGVGYMNLRSLAGELPQFKKDVAEMFRQVAADHDRKLIIDLRNNGGGDSRLSDELLRYFTTTPYRQTTRKDWKMSAEYRAYLKSYLRPPLNLLPVEHLSSQGRELFDGPPGQIVSLEDKMIKPVRGEPFFTGTVCILIGPRTFSSAADLADAVKTFHLATLIGDETGGRPNTFGEIYPFVLPHSGFSGTVSSAYFLRASGDTSDRRGVVPDIIVAPTREDLQTGRDVVLERARAQ